MQQFNFFLINFPTKPLKSWINAQRVVKIEGKKGDEIERFSWNTLNEDTQCQCHAAYDAKAKNFCCSLKWEIKRKDFNVFERWEDFFRLCHVVFCADSWFLDEIFYFLNFFLFATKTRDFSDLARISSEFLFNFYQFWKKLFTKWLN